MIGLMIMNKELITNYLDSLYPNPKCELNYSKDYEGIYDGNSHTFNSDVRLDNYTIIYSLNNSVLVTVSPPFG